MVNLRKNKIAYWIAILAILLIILTPLLSHAFTVSDEFDEYDVICSSSGIKLVNTNESNKNSDVHPMVHCSYCFLSDETKISSDYRYKVMAVNHLEDKVDNIYSLQFPYKYFLVSLLPNAPPTA
jgi:hypothetical protein